VLCSTLNPYLWLKLQNFLADERVRQPYISTLTGFRAIVAWLFVVYPYSPFPWDSLSGVPAFLLMSVLKGSYRM
jgi:hypothetical protein